MQQQNPPYKSYKVLRVRRETIAKGRETITKPQIIVEYGRTWGAVLANNAIFQALSTWIIKNYENVKRNPACTMHAETRGAGIVQNYK